jgi:hypothetical protein
MMHDKLKFATWLLEEGFLFLFFVERRFFFFVVHFFFSQSIYNTIKFKFQILINFI